MTNIVELFLNTARQYPHKPALVWRNNTITYQQLAEQVIQTAAYFQSRGITRGDRVLVFVPMNTDLYRSVLALFYLGATCVFLDEWVNKKRMEICCNIAQCKGMIGIWKAHALALFSSELRKIPVRLGTSYKKHLPHPTPAAVTADDTALITFTTGSTGTPKAVKRTHGFLNEQFNALLDEIQPHPDDVDMPVLPIVLLMNLGVGACSVIADYKASKPDSMKPSLIVNQLQHYNVNRITASPFFVEKLAEHVLQTKQQVGSLKKIFTGGAPVFPSQAQRLVAAFANADCKIVYGSTEAEPISSIQANELAQHTALSSQGGLPVGTIFHKAEVKIISILDTPLVCEQPHDLDKYCLPTYTIGEIIVAGAHVLQQYLNNPEALARNKIFVGKKCWHRTGDSGFVDKKGNLFLTGRCNTIININGRIVAPFLYEGLLQNAGAVLATVVQVNKKIVVVAELKNGGTKGAIETCLQQNNLIFDEIRLLPRMPRDPRHNSKIDYEKLKQQLQQGK